jgi:hypothetical protein
VPESHQKAAAFVRGFFTFLESRQVRSAVIHGGADGFEHELSDVDFVVDRHVFPELASHIDDYCAHAGWQLCQILRHETTAAYFVCSATANPAIAVALDACSDYQRNGSVFLPAEMLLEDRQPLAWGGYGLSAATELRYRFTKAAAKNKVAATCETEFSHYSEESRLDCTTWLDERWSASPASWNAADLATAFKKLRAKSNQRPSLLQAGALARILSRILRPSGLVVIADQVDFDATAAMLERVFGHLYFRRFRKCQHWQPAMLKDLVASTLIVVPELGAFWRQVLPADCIHRMAPGEDCQAIAEHLHQRCRWRCTAGAAVKDG